MTGMGERLRRTLVSEEVGTPRIDVPRDLTAAPGSLAGGIGGAEVSTPRGACWVIDLELPTESVHGNLPLGAGFGPDWTALVDLSPHEALRATVSREALFLDLETTGLDHGAGTQVFLAGLAWREGDTIHLRQILIREPSEEPALLHVLMSTVAGRLPLVTFNGASFDLTLLKSRCSFHRRHLGTVVDLKERPHLDLLHLCRSLFRGGLPNTRLSTLERERLGFHREDDVPGHLVPERWYDFVNTGEPAAIQGVLDHNVHDVLSMITLTALLGQEVRRCRVGDGEPRFAVNLGRLLLRRRRSADAYGVLQRWERNRNTLALEGQRDGLRLLAIAARREREVDVQRETLERLIEIARTDSQAMVDLAILEEHRARDLTRALAWAEAAHALEQDPETGKRLLRLRRRLKGAVRPQDESTALPQTAPLLGPGRARLGRVLDAADRSP